MGDKAWDVEHGFAEPAAPDKPDEADKRCCTKCPHPRDSVIHSLDPNGHQFIPAKGTSDEAVELAQEWIDTYGVPDDVEALADVIRTHRTAGARSMRERAASHVERDWPLIEEVKNVLKVIAEQIRALDPGDTHE